MNTPTLPTASPTTAAQSRNGYQAMQVAGIVAPFVGALARSADLDCVLAIPFLFEEMAHPSRPTLKLSVVIQRALQAAVTENMRVDSLESARTALMQASRYSEWTEASYAPLLQLLDIAMADQRSKRAAAKAVPH